MTKAAARPRWSAVALWVALGLGGGCGERPRHSPLPQAATVIALGDSLTYGTGATQDTSYPAILSIATGWRVVNAGVPGETAAEGCARLPELLAEHRPGLVLVLLGGNDFLRRMPEQGIRDALASCVRDARAANTPLVLLSVPRFGIGGLGVASLYAETGDGLGVPVIESGLRELLGRASMRADAVHLNAAGYRELAMTVAEGLRAQGWLAR